MKISGTINKMHVKYTFPIEYELPIGKEFINVNNLIGKEITISYSDEIFCRSCGNPTVKSFAQGYCYPCFISIPETSPCILHPELCEAHLGIWRDEKWSEENCLTDQYVYLAVSSGLKVGVTRATQIPTRWIDQGASSAIIFAKVPNRYLAGIIEVELKKYISDRTSWQKMLKNQIANDIDLLQEKKKYADLLPEKLKKYISNNNEISNFEYPVKKYPAKVKSINLDKDKIFTGMLIGIKGQYLIFENNRVINIRKYGGYFIELDIN